MHKKDIEELRVKYPELQPYILVALNEQDKLEEYTNKQYCIITESSRGVSGWSIRGFDERQELVDHLINDLVINNSGQKIKGVYKNMKKIQYKINFSVQLEEEDL